MVYAESVIDTITVGDSPIGVTANPITNKIYVANFSDAGTVSVIDGNTDTVIDTITVGNFPERVTANPTTNKIYVANEFDDTVSVIDGTTDTVIDTITVGDDPAGITANPTTNKIYVTNAADDTVSVIADIIPPTIGEVSGITVEATSQDGTIVDYTLPEVMDDDPNPTISCDPSSGSLFPIDLTTVTCTAEDVSGNTSESTFDVTVEDTTPPTIGPVSDITVEATSQDGTIVDYTLPEVTDVADPNALIVCGPAGLFAIGTTTVTCFATDVSTNTSTVSFTVTVLELSAVELFCNGMTIDQLISSGQYNVIDNRDNSLGNVLQGTFSNDLILASNTVGNDISGRAGADCIIGGAGNDIIKGNAGNDIIFGNDGSDRLIGGIGNDLILAGSGNDEISGGFGDDAMDGGNGNDSIQGQFGNDFLAGRAGDDSLNGGLGTDTCVSDGEDTTTAPIRCEL